MEDCFEGIISFENLNSAHKKWFSVEENDKDGDPRPSGITSAEAFDINEYLSNPNASLELPRTPVVCKPFEHAYDEVFKVANIDPQRTVRISIYFCGQ